MVRKRENRDKHSRKHIYFCGMVGFDIALYDFFIDFGLFFLATIAGVPAGIAGAFISVGAIFQGVFSPIVGHISDRSTAKAGRRRLYMLWGVLISVAALMILFVPLPDIDALKIVFFGIATLAFWIMYTVFYTPFLAFGGECAKTYDDRTLLRTVVTIANNAGDIILTVMTTGAVAVFVGFGISRHNSWCMATAIFCFFCVLFVLLGYRLTKGYDTVIPKEEKQEKLHIGAEMKQIYESYKEVEFFDHSHEEVVMYGAHADSHFKGVKNIYFKYGGVGIEFAKGLVKTGMLSLEEEEWNGQKIVPYDFVCAHVPHPPKFKEDIKTIIDEGIIRDEGAAVAEAYGIKDGKNIKVEAHINAPGLVESYEKAGITAEQFLTGQSGALFTKMIVNDDFMQKGFITTDMMTEEEVDKYFEYAAQLGITVEYRVIEL